MSRAAVVRDIQNILEKAAQVDGFMSRNRLTGPVQNDWALVRGDLNMLAKAYGMTWEWNRDVLPEINSSRESTHLSNAELKQLIQRIETGCDTFRSSLTDAFDLTPYDRTTGESRMNDAVLTFKKATDQLINQFDAGQPVAGSVVRVLARATPVDTYMRNHQLTNQVQSDWTTLRGYLNTIAGAYDVTPNWGGVASRHLARMLGRIRHSTKVPPSVRGVVFAIDEPPSQAGRLAWMEYAPRAALVSTALFSSSARPGQGVLEKPHPIQALFSPNRSREVLSNAIRTQLH
jgi:hypothetical protein